jgi:hypothetical protein
MIITAFFTEEGIPQTGLSPVIKIRDIISGNVIINNESMIEVGDGFYNYNFSTYDNDNLYSFLSDGGEVLPLGERYVVATNETGSIKYDTESIITDVSSVKGDTTSSLTKLDNIKVDTGYNREIIDNIKSDTGLILKIEKNKWAISENKMRFFDDDNTTVLYEFNLLDGSGQPTMRSVMQRIPV